MINTHLYNIKHMKSNLNLMREISYIFFFFFLMHNLYSRNLCEVNAFLGA